MPGGSSNRWCGTKHIHTHATGDQVGQTHLVETEIIGEFISNDHNRDTFLCISWYI